ncbi:hypothetical protein CYMTET_10909, partial [Cymbomonas tetramitiformis]
IFNANRNSLNMLRAFKLWHEISAKTFGGSVRSDELEEKGTRQMMDTVKHPDASGIMSNRDMFVNNDSPVGMAKGAPLDTLSAEDSVFRNHLPGDSLPDDSAMSIKEALSEVNLVKENLLSMHQQMVGQLKMQQAQISHILEQSARVLKMAGSQP